MQDIIKYFFGFYSINSFRKKLHNPLYKNYFFLLLNSIFSAGFGAIFWFFAALTYSQGDVGIVTALISAMGLLMSLSRIGLDQSIIRFFPEEDKSKLFSISIYISTFFLIIGGIIFIISIELVSPELSIVSNIPSIFLIFLVFDSLFTFTNITFIAIRKAEYAFIQTLVMGMRIPLLFLLNGTGIIGLFSSIGLSYIFSSCFSLFILSKCRIKFVKVESGLINKIFSFSLGSYISSLLITTPNQLLPLMVLNNLGAENTAIYYIVYSIASVIFIIPNAFSTSLFVEGSHGIELKKNAFSNILIILGMLLPIIVLIILFGKELLNFIGSDYIDGYYLLVLLSISSIFVTFFSLYYSMMRVQKNIKGLIIFGFIIFSLILLLSYFFFPSFGINSPGYAWIITYGLISIFIIIILRRRPSFQ